MCFLYLYVLIKNCRGQEPVEGKRKWKRKCVLHSTLSNFLLPDRESCRGMGRRQPKKLGAGVGAYLAGLLHVFCIYNVISVVHQKIGLLIKLFVVVVWKKSTGKLQMKRIGFSDKRSHWIKEWAETNIVHLTIVSQAYKWKTLKIVHC